MQRMWKCLWFAAETALKLKYGITAIYFCNNKKGRKPLVVFLTARLPDISIYIYFPLCVTIPFLTLTIAFSENGRQRVIEGRRKKTGGESFCSSMLSAGIWSVKLPLRTDLAKLPVKWLNVTHVKWLHISISAYFSPNKAHGLRADCDSSAAVWKWTY